MFLMMVAVVLCGYLVYAILSYEQYEPVIVYPKVGKVYGIDVSHHQEHIDWQRLKREAHIDGQPVSFVYIKATDGIDFIDSAYAYNYAEARTQGIACGSYHFYRPKVSSKLQAEFFLQHSSFQKGDLPPMLDVERLNDEQSIEAYKWGIIEWLSIVEKEYGVKPVLYTYDNLKINILNDVVFEQYPHWIAHYDVEQLEYQGPWCFWQFSEKGELPGIKGHVDLNVFNGTVEELQMLIK